MTSYTIHPATPKDIPALVKHRRQMFEEINLLRGQPAPTDGLDAMDKAYAPHLQQHLADGSLKAWVVEFDGQAVASGAVAFQLLPPAPWNLTECVAYVHSIYTAPEHRRKGLARQVMEALIANCQECSLVSMALHASEAGRPLYEALGFELVTNYMRLKL